MYCLCILIQVSHKSWQTRRNTNEAKYFRKENGRSVVENLPKVCAYKMVQRLIVWMTHQRILTILQIFSYSKIVTKLNVHLFYEITHQFDTKSF